MERRNLLVPLTAVAALAAGCPVVGPSGGDEGAARFAETASRDEATGSEAPDSADGRAHGLLIFEEGLRDEARRAVTARGGRVLVAFDEPALVVRFPEGAPDALAHELPGAILSVGPIDDESLAASAPGAVGFWNRRHGVDGPLAHAAPAGSMERPVGHALSRRPFGPEQELSPELDRRARGHLRGFLECLGEAPSHEVCLVDFVAPEEQDRLRTLLEREHRVVRRHGLDVRDYSFEPRRFDGVEAEYEIQRQGRPSGVIRVSLQGDRWAVAEVDP